MAASRKPPSDSFAVGLSGGIDSVVLLHALHAGGAKISAIHVNHGLSPNALRWERFCKRFCKSLGVPLEVHRVQVKRTGSGLEAAAREARRAAFLRSGAQVIVLAHNRDDQAETVLHHLLRGAGLNGAKGMQAEAALGHKRLDRPLLDVPRSAILDYARAHRLKWIEDESNADVGLTRNFIRHEVGRLLATRFPRWKDNLARAARHFASGAMDERLLLRAWLKAQGLRSPSEAKLREMIKQLGSSGSRIAMPHDGRVLRAYRNKVFLEKRHGPAPARAAFEPRVWNGERKLELPELNGAIEFERIKGRGIDLSSVEGRKLEVKLRSGGERLQPDPRRPRRTLKNLFQEAGVPAWQRERLPMLFRGPDLVWVPGLGVDAAFAVAPGKQGIVPAWRPDAR